jgi:polar amino acid transport system substrate-binding protein
MGFIAPTVSALISGGQRGSWRAFFVPPVPLKPAIRSKLESPMEGSPFEQEESEAIDMWPGFEHVIGPGRRLTSSRRVLLLAVVATAVGPAGGMAQTPTRKAALHLGSTPWSPFTNEPGKPRFAIDLVQEALKRAGITSDTTVVADGALTPALLEGKFDGSPALWRDPVREEKLVYSKPYLENRLVLVAKRGYDVSAPALPALAGKRIALVDGFAYGDALKSPKGPAYVAASTVEESLQKVLGGEADYALMDELVVQFLLTNYPEEVKTRLAVGTEPLVVRSLHFAVRKDVPGAQSIVDRFDAEVGKMIADHSYHRFLQVGWIQADVDGDGRTEWVPASDQAGQEAPVRRYELVTVTASGSKPESQKRFYLGGKVYDDWKDVPERYKVIDKNRTAWGSQVAPVFSFKW